MKRVTSSIVLCGSFLCGQSVLGQLPGQAAHYVLPDGSTQMVADTAMEPLLKRLNDLFEQQHPGSRMRLKLDSSGDVGLGGISTGTSFVSPLMRPATPQETRPFVQMRGHEPLYIAIGYVGCRTKTSMPLPALYMNANAPSVSLTWRQVAQVLTRGSIAGDITRWEQLGITGSRGTHAIHVYGPLDDGGFVSALRHAQFNGNPLALRYEAIKSTREISEAVRNDSYGIGLIEAWQGSAAPAGLRLVPIASASPAGGWKASSSGSCEDVMAKRYPFAVELRLYADATKGQLNPTALAYLIMALSQAGQTAVRESHSSSGGAFLPLNADDLAQQKAKLR